MYAIKKNQHLITSGALQLAHLVLHELRVLVVYIRSNYNVVYVARKQHSQLPLELCNLRIECTNSLHELGVFVTQRYVTFACQVQLLELPK